MKILFFISHLSAGGAEWQMAIIAKGMEKRGHRATVITLFPGGQVAEHLKQSTNVKIVSIFNKKSQSFIGRVLQHILAPQMLKKYLKNIDCIYSMLNTTNFIAFLATRFNKTIFLIWGIRSSNMAGYWKLKMFDELCSTVSDSVPLIIANSYAGLKSLSERGYNPKNKIVIPNGIDLSKFKPNKESRMVIRNELGVKSNQLLVGIVGRLTPIKDYPTFLRAAALVINEIHHLKFICVGGGPDKYLHKIMNIAKNYGIDKKIYWLGERNDMPAIYNALDLFVSSSYGEGFSNVIGEAMSTGIPCVVTDVGDSAIIVGDKGYIIPPRNPEKLAIAIISSINNATHVKKTWQIREHIQNNFSIKVMHDRTNEVLNKIISC